nr:glycosyl transferase, family 8 [Tanacetum cinerariifolium]
MENANPPPTSNRPVLPAALRAQAVQELHELQRILAFVDSRLENNDSDDGEVLNELIKYENVGMLHQEKHHLHHGFCGLEDIGEFIQINKAEVVMGKPFRKITKLEYDCTKGLMSFHRIFDNYTFQMPWTIPRFKHWRYVSWSKIPPILVLNQRDLTNGFKNAYEKNKFMYKKCLNLGPEYQVDEILSLDLSNTIAYRKFLIKNLEEFFTVLVDGIRIKPDGFASPAM